MNITIKAMAAAMFAALAFTTTAQTYNHSTGSITFSGHTWSTWQESVSGYGSGGGAATNNYAATDPNTGVISALYNNGSGNANDGTSQNNAMVTSVTLGVGYKASYDLYLADANPNWAQQTYPNASWGGDYLGNWTSQFIDGTVIGQNNDATYRTISGNAIQGGTDTGHYDIALNDGSGAQGGDGDWFNVSENLSTGVHFAYAFGLNSYTITATAIANPSETLTGTYNYENGDVNSIQGFVVGLWNSEQTATIANFTINPAPVPEPGTLALLGIGGGLGLLFMVRRRVYSGRRFC